MMIGRLKSATSQLLNMTGAVCEGITYCIDGVTYWLDAAGNVAYAAPPEEKEAIEAGPKPLIVRLHESTAAYGTSRILKGSASFISAFAWPARITSTASRAGARFIDAPNNRIFAAHYLGTGTDYLLSYLQRTYPSISAYVPYMSDYLHNNLEKIALAENPAAIVWADISRHRRSVMGFAADSGIVDAILVQIEGSLPAISKFIPDLRQYIRDNSAALLNDPSPIQIVWNVLKNAPRVIADNPVFSGLGENTATLGSSIDAFLQRAMDPALYDSMPDYAKRIKQETYQNYQPSFQDDPLYFYANIRLFPAQLSVFLPYAGKAIDNLNVAMNEEGLISDRIDAILNLITLLDPLNETFFQGVQPTFEQLRISEIPFRIPAFEDYQAALEKFLPVEKFMNMARNSDRVQTLIRDLFQSNNAGAEAALNRFLNDAGLVLPQPVPEQENSTALDRAVEIIENQLAHLEDNRVREEAKADICEALDAVTAFTHELTKYTSSDRKKLTLALFLIKSAPSVFKIIQHGSQAYSSLMTAFHDDYLSLLNDTNAFLMEANLRTNRRGLEWALKQDYISSDLFSECGLSLSMVTEKFASLITQETGLHNLFDFPEGKSPPYHEAVYRQTAEKLAELEEIPEEKDERLQEALNYRIQLLRERTVSAEQRKMVAEETAREQDRHKKANYFTKRNDAIAAVLAPLITQMAQKAGPAGAVRARRKLELLQTLDTQLSMNKSFDEAVDAIKQDPHLNSDLFQLWTGSTRNVMKQIENICLTRDSYITHIRKALVQLQNQRQRKTLFSPGPTCILLEQRIEAMKQLCTLLETPGHRPSYAIDKLNARNPVAHSILNTHDKATLDAILNMEKTICSCFDIPLSRDKVDRSISSHIFGKILIGYKQPEGAETVLGLSADKVNLITRQIEKLKKEKNTFLGFFSRPVKDDKIRLLTKIRDSLLADENLSLHAALETLSKEDASAMYKLYQGRTGRLIRELSGSELAREDVIRRVDLEIKRLCAERTVPLFFFPSPRKQALESHIAALQLLKDEIENPDNADVEINILYARMEMGDGFRHLLETRSRSLLEAIGATLPVAEAEAGAAPVLQVAAP